MNEAINVHRVQGLDKVFRNLILIKSKSVVLPYFYEHNAFNK
jgi:hypothetical protein